MSTRGLGCHCKRQHGGYTRVLRDTSGLGSADVRSSNSPVERGDYRVITLQRIFKMDYRRMFVGFDLAKYSTFSTIK